MVREQSRFSPELLSLTRMGIPLPFRNRPVAGLVIVGARGDTLFDAMRNRRVFGSYAEVPPVVARSLLYIENRRLQSDRIPTLNPALDWGRMVKASGLWIGRQLGLPLRIEGGSTLAVQLVKYHHANEGRTRSPLD